MVHFVPVCVGSRTKTRASSQVLVLWSFTWKLPPTCTTSRLRRLTPRPRVSPRPASGTRRPDPERELRRAAAHICPLKPPIVECMLAIHDCDREDLREVARRARRCLGARLHAHAAGTPSATA